MHLEVISRLSASTPRPTPLLFVHGASHAAWCWDEHFLPYFAEHGYSAYALSLRGHGDSEGRERLRWWRIRDYVADVRQVAESLPAPPVVIGHSMGGFIVQKYLERYNAPGGVLVASAPVFGMFPLDWRLLMQHPLLFLRVNAAMYVKPMFNTRARTRALLYSALTPHETVERTFARVQNESYAALLDMTLFDLPRPRKVHSPLLVLGGTEDGFFTPRETRITARAYGTEAVLVLDTGHNLMLEPSWQTTADHILSWLAERGL